MTTELVLYAAGSLRGALLEIAAAFTRQYDTPIRTVFGPSDLLRERLEQAGRGGPVVLFARNRVYALVAPGVVVTSQTLLDRMLEPGLTLGTATPITDPLGDYTWEVFRRSDALRAGSFETLSTKARRLIGGGSLPPIPAGQSTLAHGSSCRETLRVAPTLRMVELPPELAVEASFGLTMLAEAPPPAATLALFILSQEGQTILAQHGFAAPLLSVQSAHPYVTI